MKRLVQIWLFAATLGLAGCAEEGRYPISGEDCKPTDPVKDISVADCVVFSG